MGYSTQPASEIYQEILKIYKFLARNSLIQTQESIMRCNKSRVQQMP